MADMSATMLVPAVDPDSAFYWKGLREERFLVQQCTECGRGRFPPMPACPFCASAKTTTMEPSGRGRVYSWVIVRRAVKPAFVDQVPYVIATVDLDEGVRLIGRLDELEPTAGMEVECFFFDHADWTELRVRPVADAGKNR